MLRNTYICLKRVMNEIKNDQNITYINQEFGCRWMSIETKCRQTSLLMNANCIIAFLPKVISINSWNDHCI